MLPHEFNTALEHKSGIVRQRILLVLFGIHGEGFLILTDKESKKFIFVRVMLIKGGAAYHGTVTQFTDRNIFKTFFTKQNQKGIREGFSGF